MKVETHKSSAHVDRGWAWMVCIAGHFCTAFTVGYATSLGVLFIEWKEHFDLSATASSWVVGMPLVVAGPISLIVGVVAPRLDIRRVSMLGSAVNGLATILGSFSADVWHLYLSGAVAGVGTAMIVYPALAILAHYFKKRFTLANGLVFLGIGTGQTIFPPLLRLFIENYGWRGAMLIVGAIQMNGVAACALFRPLKVCPDKVRRGGERLKGFDNEGAIDTDIETAISGTQRNIVQETQTPDQTRKTINTENEQPDDSLKNHLYEAQISQRQLETEGLDKTKTADTIPIEAVVLDQQLGMKLHVQGSVQTRRKGSVSPENGEATGETGEVSRQDNNADRRTAAARNQSCPEKNRVRRKLQDPFGLFDVFSNPKIMLITFASCLFTIGLNANVSHLPARVKEAGWSEDQGALVLSIYATLSIVTRAAHGWFVDRNYISAFKLQSIVLLGCAIVTFLNPVSDSLIYLIGYGALLGGFTGIGLPLTIVTAKSVARPSQIPLVVALVLSVLFLFGGTGSVIAGKIYDATGNYVVPFFAGGAMFLASFILTVIVAVCKRRRQIE